jgi:L-lactate dehydrogenase
VTFLAEACLDADPIDNNRPVRLPGQAALAKKNTYLEKGVPLEPGILPSLEEWSDKLGVPMPAPVGD